MSALGRLSQFAALHNELNRSARSDRDERPPTPWVLFGSAVLLLHGLRDEICDVDVFVSEGTWREISWSWTPRWRYCHPEPNDPGFLQATFAGHEVHLFKAWTDRDPEVDARQCLRAAELIDGWWCTPLEIVRMQKAMSIPKYAGTSSQLKHVRDVFAIDEHLRRRRAAA